MKQCVNITMWSKNLNHEDLEWFRDIAREIEIKGITYFKNDGSVKIIAEGEEKLLLFFIKKIKRGKSIFSFFSPTENFSINWESPKEEFDNFYISESLE